MDHQSETIELVKELLLRLIVPSTEKHSQNLNESEEFKRALKYAIRILNSRFMLSIASDETSMAESIKRTLVNRGRSSDALTFADLYAKFSSKRGPGSVANKWSVLYLLKLISEDCHKRRPVGHYTPNGLPLLVHDTSASAIPKSPLSLDHKSKSGVLFISKDPDTIRETALREFADIVSEESEVPEDFLVRDILFTCQGIDGKFIKFNSCLDGYSLLDSLRISRSTEVLVRKHCELGWLFRKIKNYICKCMDHSYHEEVGTVGQAFVSALQEELSDYYKLLAVLETQSRNHIPHVSDASSLHQSGNYLSLRRLAVWLSEPKVKMRLMAILVDNCMALRGGALAGAIHIHAQHGDPMVQDFMRHLLQRVCSPLYEMVRSWVLEGELNDMFQEFFVIGRPVKIDSLWQDGYLLHNTMLPEFISQSLAHRILRTGKSINFLRSCCDDHGWAKAASDAAAAAGIAAEAGGFVYGENDALENLINEAAKRLDKHLLNVIYGRYKFKEHCLAIKRYLLLGQGDFVQYLMDVVGPELSEPTSVISSFKLAGLLETAVRSSNAQYDAPDILDRLHVKMMQYSVGERGWDAFSLEYGTGVPLNTVFTESVMARYLRIFNFLWQLRRVEHALIGAWKKMKPNFMSSGHFATKLGSSFMVQFISVSRRCQAVWNEMNHFIRNLQYYIMLEVLEVSWSLFAAEMETSRDMDDLLGAHNKYLNSILERSLLAETSAHLYKSLFAIFDLILRYQGHVDQFYEDLYELQQSSFNEAFTITRRSRMRPNYEPSSTMQQVGEGRKALMKYAGELFDKINGELSAVAKEYSSSLESFIAQLTTHHKMNMKFLLFRLEFSQFYSQSKI